MSALKRVPAHEPPPAGMPDQYDFSRHTPWKAAAIPPLGKLKRMIFGLAALMAGAAFAGDQGAELAIRGEFKVAKKAGSPPAGWTKLSNSKGTLEVIPSEDGVYVALAADAKGRVGIHSAPVAVKAGDAITVSARVIGESMVFALFQYGTGKTSSQRATMKSGVGEEGEVLSHVFTVADGPEGTTETARIAFWVENGANAAVGRVKAVQERK